MLDLIIGSGEYLGGEYLRISPTKSTFSLGKNFGETRHLCEKNEPTLDRFGGGVHGKVCWLIA